MTIQRELLNKVDPVLIINIFYNTNNDTYIEFVVSRYLHDRKVFICVTMNIKHQ